MHMDTLDPDETALTLVFVYGTLRHGGANHNLLADAAYCGLARTVKPMRLSSDGNLPYLIDAPAAAPVLGELYAVDGWLLAELDAFEGAPDFYVRQDIEIVPANAPPAAAGLRAQAYLMPADRIANLHLRDITHGDYLADARTPACDTVFGTDEQRQ